VAAASSSARIESIACIADPGANIGSWPGTTPEGGGPPAGLALSW
jgi:hypothetical protein